MMERVRRRSKRRGSKGGVTPVPTPDWDRHRRALMPSAVLSEEDIDAIHKYSLSMLSNTGLEFMLPEALDILAAAGADVDRASGIVRFDPDLVMEYVSKAPSSFEIQGRTPSARVKIGKDQIVYGSVASTPNASDMDTGRRPGNRADFQALTKLSHMIDTCSLFSGYPVEPTDLPANTRHLDCCYDFLTLSDKPFRVYGIGPTRARDALRLIEIGHGIDRATLRQGPRALTVMNVNSPLRVDGPLLQGAMEFARNNQAVIVTPVAFGGAMSPISISGSLIQHNAECLAAIAFIQMVNPGTPVFYGSIFTNTDMKSGAPAFGTPDALIGMLATGQLARRYDIPQRVMNGSTSNAEDAQAAYEAMFSLWAAYLGGAHLVFHAFGLMEAGLCTSFEKLVLDAEMIGMMSALGRPIDLSDAPEVLKAIDEVGPGGHFLGTDHTLARYKTAFHEPILSDWRPFEFWSADGAPDTATRANAKWKAMLAEYEKPPLDPAIDEALKAFVAQRKAEIGDTEI